MAETLIRRTIWSELRVVLAIMLRGLKISLRYRLNFISGLFWSSVTVLGVILMGHSFGATAGLTEAIGTPDYVSFLILGKIPSYLLLGATINGIARSMREDQLSGTLELTYTCPIRRVSLFAGYSLSHLTGHAIHIFSTVVISVLLLGLRFNTSPLNILLLIPWFVLSCLACYGSGFIIAGLVSRIKEPGVLTILISWPFYYLSGFYFTISAIPEGVRSFAFLIPTSYSVDCFKGLLIGSKTFLPIIQELLILLAFAITLPLVGYRVFLWLEKDAMKRGTLFTY